MTDVDGYYAYQHSRDAPVVSGAVVKHKPEGLEMGAIGSPRELLSRLIWKVNTNLGGWCAIYSRSGKMVHVHHSKHRAIPDEFQKFDTGEVN